MPDRTWSLRAGRFDEAIEVSVPIGWEDPADPAMQISQGEALMPGSPVRVVVGQCPLFQVMPEASQTRLGGS